MFLYLILCINPNSTTVGVFFYVINTMRNVEIIVDGFARIPKQIADRDEIELALSFKNPEYLAKVRFGSFYGKMPEQYLEFWEETSSHFIVPRNYPQTFLKEAYRDYIVERHNVVSRRFERNKKFKGSLRDYQEVYLETIKASNPTDFLIQAPCGHGKTVMTIYYIVEVLKQRSIVIVPTSALADQWFDSFEYLTENLVVTKVTAQRKIILSYILESDIIIITNDLLRSLLEILYNSVSIAYARFSGLKEYMKSNRIEEENAVEIFSKTFGCVVLDEYHRFGAHSWVKAIGAFHSKYRISCTATPRRGDDMYKLLELHTGERFEMENQFEKAHVYYLQTGARVVPEFNHLAEKRIRDAKDSIGAYREKLAWFQNWVRANKFVHKENPDEWWRIDVEEALKNINTVKEEYRQGFKRALDYAQSKFTVGQIDTQILLDAKRLKKMQGAIITAIESGRTVLVLSKRREVLITLHNVMTKEGFKSCVIVGGSTGTSKNKTVMEYARTNAQVIFGISQLVKEGLDIDRLDTLILLHPLSDMEQAVGRTLRALKGKKQPIVIGVEDNIREYKGIVKKGNKNLGHAINKGYISSKDIVKIFE